MPCLIMVTYQRWTAIAFEVAARKGLRTAAPGGQQNLRGGRSFAGDEPQNRVMQAVARGWREHEARIRGSNASEARAIAGDLLKFTADDTVVVGP